MINYLIIISNLKLKENHEKSSLTLSLSLSFWLHAERNGFYLGSDILGGSYVQATVNTNEFNPNNLLNNPYPQNYPSSPSPSNSNNPYAKNTIHQLVRFQAIQTIQTLYHPLVDQAVFSVKSALGINIFWVKKGL
ncbi:hypothetical protein Taiwan2_07270 [Helicobacter pylori]